MRTTRTGPAAPYPRTKGGIHQRDKELYEKPIVEYFENEVQAEDITTSSFDYDDDNNWTGGAVPQD